MKSTLSAMLAAEHSKAQTDLIAKWVGKNQKRFDELYKIFMDMDNRLAQRASWVLSIILSAEPSLLEKHYRQLLDKLKIDGQHNAIYRNGLKAIASNVIPEEYEGALMDLCLKVIESMGKAIAAKAHALTILEQLSKKYPEIIPEIKTSVDIHLPGKTAALRARTRWLEKIN